MPFYFCCWVAPKIQQHNTSWAVLCLHEFHFCLVNNSSCLFVLGKFFVWSVCEACWRFREIFIVWLRLLHFCAWIWDNRISTLNRKHFLRAESYTLKGASKMANPTSFAPKVKEFVVRWQAKLNLSRGKKKWVGNDIICTGLRQFFKEK